MMPRSLHAKYITHLDAMLSVQITHSMDHIHLSQISDNQQMEQSGSTGRDVDTQQFLLGTSL